MGNISNYNLDDAIKYNEVKLKEELPHLDSSYGLDHIADRYLAKQKKQTNHGPSKEIINELEQAIEKHTKDSGVKIKDYEVSNLAYWINRLDEYYKIRNYGIFMIDDDGYIPSSVIVQRASALDMGPNILGTAQPGLRLIRILDTLYGKDFLEVLKHEVNHILFPHLSEWQIRYKTHMDLNFQSNHQV